MDKIDVIVSENQDVWKTRSAFFSWLKGIVRLGWSKHPVRTKHLKKHAVKIENTNPRSMKRFPFVNAFKCSICGEMFKQNDVEVDHILEETASLTSLGDVQSCVEKLLVVKDSDLRILCKGCHSIVTLQQKLGISFEEAAIEQRVIHMIKNKEDKHFLAKNNVVVGNNEKARRLQLRELLKGLQNDSAKP